jgi:hypothetical protein
MHPEISLVLLQRPFASGGVLPSTWPFGLFDREGKTMPLSAETLEEYAKVCVELARESDTPDVRCAYRRSRPPIPTDRDHLFRSIATSVARVLTAPLDDGGDVSLLKVGQARREAVPVVNRRDPRATRSALTAGAAARAGGPC